MGKLFGTDGIRGIANDTLGCELATRVGRAAATLFSDKNRRPAVIIGWRHLQESWHPPRRLQHGVPRSADLRPKRVERLEP